MTGKLMARGSVVWAAALIIGLAGAIAYMLVATPLYRVRTTVMYMESDAASGQLAALLSQFGSLSTLAGLAAPVGGSDRARAMAMLVSKELGRDFAIEEDLLPAMFPERWDRANHKWISSSPSDWQIGERFTKTVLKVSTDAKSEITTIRVTWPDPRRASEIADRYVSYVNERLRDLAMRESQSALEFLDRELASAKSVELREAIARISEARLKSLMLARTKPDFAFTVVDRAVVPPTDQRFRPSIVIAVLLAAGLSAALVAVAYVFRRLRSSISVP